MMRTPKAQSKIKKLDKAASTKRASVKNTPDKLKKSAARSAPTATEKTVVKRKSAPTKPTPKSKRINRDIEKAYPKAEFIAKIRRLADALEQNKRFSIQIANHRVTIPAHAVINIEHEASGDSEEIEFQLVWKR